MATLPIDRSLQVEAELRIPPVTPAIREHDWFAGVYAATAESVYRFALMLVREPFCAEDISAEVYLRAWGARHRLTEQGSVVAWLLSITRNCALDELRKRSEHVQLDMLADHQDMSESLCVELSESDITSVHEAIRRLTREQQQVIFLRFFEELPHESVAVRLGKSPTAVRAIQFRALARMRKLLGLQVGKALPSSQGR